MNGSEVPVQKQSRHPVDKLYNLSGEEIINSILDLPAPEAFVHSISEQDFYWIIKKIGEHECIPILELASEKQWEYVFDMEIWHKWHIDIEKTGKWLDRLLEADPIRFAKWFFREGQSIGYYYLCRSIVIHIKEPDDEEIEFDPDFYSLDGTFFFKAINKENFASMDSLLKLLAREDFDLYQNMLINLNGVIPSDLEESMLRMRSVRLSEHGFLPREEALSVYAPMEAESFKKKKQGDIITINEASDVDDESFCLSPVLPIKFADNNSFFAAVFSSSMGNITEFERLSLEFAGLCNQLIAADDVLDCDIGIFRKTVAKASAYVSIGIEILCGNNLSAAAELVNQNTLESLFRLGFGTALKVKWKADAWLKPGKNWFKDKNYSHVIWGERYAGILEGLSKKYPLFYTGFSEYGEEFRHFEKFNEIKNCEQKLYEIIALDNLCSVLSSDVMLLCRFPEEGTCESWLLSLWCRYKIGKGFSAHPIDTEDIKTFFENVRKGVSRPPYRMKKEKKEFSDFFLDKIPKNNPTDRDNLKNALMRIWVSFEEETININTADIDINFLKSFNTV